MIDGAVFAGRVLPWDDRRGSAGMHLFILTEAFLFIVLFFAYFYLGRTQPHWPPDPPPLTMAIVMLVVLSTSSAVLYGADRVLRRGRPALARLAIGVTMLLGGAFLVLQGLEYQERLETLRPSTDAYGSIFYTITSVHGLHVVLGLLMLAFVVLIPELEPAHDPPYRALHNATRYWHFVDAVWVVIVAILYLLPRLGS